MNEKQKAVELVEKYSEVFPKNYDKNGNNFFKENAKQCALIAVEFANENPLNTYGYTNYLKRIRTEIQNL